MVGWSLEMGRACVWALKCIWLCLQAWIRVEERGSGTLGLPPPSPHLCGVVKDLFVVEICVNATQWAVAKRAADQMQRLHDQAQTDG